MDPPPSSFSTADGAYRYLDLKDFWGEDRNMLDKCKDYGEKAKDSAFGLKCWHPWNASTQGRMHKCRMGVFDSAEDHMKIAISSSEARDMILSLEGVPGNHAQDEKVREEGSSGEGASGGGASDRKSSNDKAATEGSTDPGTPNERTSDRNMVEERPAKDGANTETANRRRLYILENMDPRIVELLAVTHQIPPDFFLAHCSGKHTFRVVDGMSTRQNSTTYWRVAVPELRHVPYLVSVEPGSMSGITITSGNFDRGIIRSEIPNPFVKFKSYVSFWCRENGAGSWTAILLVDPQKAWLSGWIKLRSWRSEVSQSALNSSDTYTDPNSEKWLYDMLAEADPTLAVTADPFSATACVRSLIQAKWDKYMQIWDMAIPLSATNGRIGNSYMWGYGFDHTENSMIKEDMMRLRFWDGELSKVMWEFRPRNGGSRGGEDSHPWVPMKDTLSRIDRSIRDLTADMNRQTALRDARSSGQLTKIATAIVPCAFIASLFSMGGEFAVGGRFFYLYWAISLPITLILLTWVTWDDIMKRPWNEIMAAIQRLRNSCLDLVIQLGLIFPTRILRLLALEQWQEKCIEEMEREWKERNVSVIDEWPV